MNHRSSAPVLLIESDAVARDTLAGILRGRHLVTDVGSSAEAVAHLSLATEMPCLIMVVLRDGDGNDTFRTTQQAEAKWAQIPIVLFSPNSSTQSTGFIDALFAITGRHCDAVQ